MEPLRFAPVAALALALALATLACTRELPPVDQKPVPRPAGVLVEASLPGLSAGTAGLAAFGEAVQPGLGAMVGHKLEEILAAQVGLASLDGVKHDAPVWLIMLDPKPMGRRNALLVGVADEGKLRAAAGKAGLRIQGGRALVGETSAVETLAPYAFTTLARREVPAAPTAIVDAPLLLREYGDAMVRIASERARDQEASAFASERMDALLDLLRACDALELRLEASADGASVELALLPHPGNELSSIVAAQKPADAGLLERLPAVSTLAIVGAGHLELGPLRERLRGLLHDWAARSKHRTPGVLMDAIARVLDDATGSFAVSEGVGEDGLHLDELIGIGDPARAQPLLTTLFGGIGTQLPSWKAPGHDGVSVYGHVKSLDEEDGAPAAYPGGKAYYLVAAWDDVIGFSLSGSGTLDRLIDASRGKAARLALPPGFASRFAASRQRGESAAFMVDLNGFDALDGKAAPTTATGTGLLVAVGFQGGRARLRIELPTALVRHLIAHRRAAK